MGKEIFAEGREVYRLLYNVKRYGIRHDLFIPSRTQGLEDLERAAMTWLSE
jgi:hypothetical protein